MIVHTQKVMPILSSVLMLIIFSWPCVSGSTSGTSRGCRRLIPPHSVGKPYTNLPPSSIVTLPRIRGVDMEVISDTSIIPFNLIQTPDSFVSSLLAWFRESETKFGLSSIYFHFGCLIKHSLEKELQCLSDIMTITLWQNHPKLGTVTVPKFHFITL